MNNGASASGPGSTRSAPEAPVGLRPAGDDPSRELDALIARLKKARGTPQRWLEREMLVLRFIAAIEEPARVFCRGEVRLPDKGHYPAVLTYNPIYKQTLAWAPSGRKDKMTGHHEAFFWSNMPHVGIAREVLLEPETSAYNGGAPSPRAEGIAEPQSAKAKDGDWR